MDTRRHPQQNSQKQPQKHPKKQSRWESSAICNKNSSELFFPPMDFEPSKLRRKREIKAKAICRVCPVSDNCLSYALKHDYLEGIWGGTNFKERKQRNLLMGIARNK